VTPSNTSGEMRGLRSDLATAVAIALAAYALCDLAHEALGHGLAALMTPGVRVVSLTTVALQTAGINSRIVAAAGPVANILFGAVALAIFHRMARLSPTGYFVWLFGILNLMNGTGYLLFSAVLGSGDWAVVIGGLEPVWLWRLVLGIVGAAAYVGVVKVSASELARAVERNSVRRADIPRVIMSSYVAGGTLLLVASIFNPISPSLILVSGLSAGFAAMAGLTLVPKLIDKRTGRGPVGDSVLPRSRGWIVVGIAVAAFFVGVVGPGIRF
jgi:hypothetical protein